MRQDRLQFWLKCRIFSQTSLFFLSTFHLLLTRFGFFLNWFVCECILRVIAQLCWIIFFFRLRISFDPDIEFNGSVHNLCYFDNASILCSFGWLSLTSCSGLWYIPLCMCARFGVYLRLVWREQRWNETITKTKAKNQRYETHRNASLSADR